MDVTQLWFESKISITDVFQQVYSSLRNNKRSIIARIFAIVFFYIK